MPASSSPPFWSSWSAGVWFRNIVIGLLALAFALFFGSGGGGGGGGGGTGAVAEIDGERIDRDIFEVFRSRLEAAQRDEQTQGIDAGKLRDRLDARARDQLIQRYVLGQGARSLGLVVSDVEVAEALKADPGWQRNGRFDLASFEAYTRQEFGSPMAYEAELRRDLLIAKFRRLLTSPIRVSGAAVRDRLRRAQTTVSLDYVRAGAKDYTDAVQVKDEEAQALVEAEPGRIEAEYRRRSAEFEKPERVRARHILFTGDDALPRAEAALARVRAGKDFVALAVELSQDEATREQGGDLGVFPRGRMLPAFEAAAFGADARSVAGPVETERGVHLIRVEEKLPAESRSLKEVELDLARELLTQERAIEAARAAAQGVLEALRKGTPMEEAARKAGLAPQRTTPFRRVTTMIPGLGRVPGLREAAFRLTPPHGVGRRVFATQDAFYVISLAERVEPDAEKIDADFEGAHEQLLAMARNEAISQWYARRLEALQRAGRLRIFDLYPPN